MKNEIQRPAPGGLTPQRGVLGVLALPALILALLIRTIIFLQEIILSFKTYNPAKGVFGSPWAGLENYTAILDTLQFGRALRNTITFNILFAIFTFIIASLAGYFITVLPKKNVLKEILATITIIPIFLPTEIYARWLFNLFTPSTFINPGMMRFLLPLFSAFKYAGIPIMVLFILDELREKRDAALPMKTAGLFTLIILAFIANSHYSLTLALYNPAVYETVDTLDTITYRSGLQQYQFSGASASGVLQTLISLLSFAVLFLPVKFLFSDTFKGITVSNIREKASNRLVAALIGFLVFSIIYFLPYVLNWKTIDMSIINSLAISAIGKYLIISVISAVIATVLASIMGLGFVSVDKKIKIVSVSVLSLITVLSAKPKNLSEWFVIRDLGLYDTIFAIILTGCFSVAAVWAMACILKNEEIITFKTILLAAIGIGLVHFAIVYGNANPALLYYRKPWLSPVLVFQQMSKGTAAVNSQKPDNFNNAVAVYGYIASLPAVFAFLIAKAALPKKYLLSVITGGMKG